MFKIFKQVYPKFEEVKQQCLELVEKFGDWDNNPDSQIAIQADSPDNDNWRSGCGPASARVDDWRQQALKISSGVSVDEYIKWKLSQWEHSFKYLQPSLKGTPIDEYLTWLEVPVHRTRIMLAREKSSYSIHNDLSPRLHLPLVTNTQCNFLFADPPLELIHMPADGTTYWVDTRRQHTFINGSTMKRLHIVMNMEN